MRRSEMNIDKRKALWILNSGESLMGVAFSAKERLSPHITYSRNVFLPLTHACRNACGYCLFRRPAGQSENIMKKKAVLSLISKAERLGCREALFTFGEKPEVYPQVKRELKGMGYSGIIEYLAELCEYISEKTSLFPHSNIGILEKEEIELLKPYNASLGLMLESSSERLMETEAHRRSPGKHHSLRIKTIGHAGKRRIPFTTGILVGIGENNEEIYESLVEIKRLAEKYGHIQEIIIQNFMPKPGTPMQNFAPLPLKKMLRIVILARLMFPKTPLQVPPNINRRHLSRFIKAGIDDLGGISPLTQDYINPEFQWPHLEELRFALKERLPVYPKFIKKEFLGDVLYKKALSVTDEEGYVRC